MKVLVLLLCFLCLFAANFNAQTSWSANLDGKIRFYQTTDFGILLTGTDNSIYAVDGENGQRIWRRGHRGLDETSVTQIPGTDLILLSLDEGKKSRLEAIDLLTGNSIWRSEKVKGDVMQLAVEPEQDLLTVILVKKAVGKVGKEFKRSPQIHVLKLSDGEELWKKELDSDVEMMPAYFGENVGEVPHTLDNYRAPMILDGKLYLFYEGVSAYDARTGKEFMREEFGINEDDLALTDADPVFDEKNVYISGRGKIRAVDRSSGEIIWKADDLGETPEMAVVNDVLYVRTGGQFTNIRTGEIEKNGPFGVSAIDTKTGKKIWRYKGADKGLTNFVFADSYTILIADKGDLISIDAKNGERKAKFEHDITDAQFVLINERGEAVVGGRDEIAAFRVSNSTGGSPRVSKDATNFQEEILKPQMNTDEHGFLTQFQKTKFKSQNEIQNPKSKIQNPNEIWRVKHKAPSRGVLRTVAGIALRATALYFRYGGLATSALNIARGVGLARSVLSLRFSGLKTRFSAFDLTTLASNSAKNYISDKIYILGSLARNPNLLSRANSLRIFNSNTIRGRIISGITPSGDDVRESILEKLDPVGQVERFSHYLLRRKRLSEIRGNFMYFYTDLPKPYDKKGFVGVNVHNGKDARFIPVSEPDLRFTTDETLGLLYSADGSIIKAFNVLNR
jgi:outer membrane protein assembly factor BamB